VPLVILVEFVIKRDATTQFRSLILANARSSLRDEAGCRRFDVLHNSDEPNRVVLYEIYDDAAAFERHVTTSHYKDFAAAAETLIETRSVKRMSFVDLGLNTEAERKTAGRIGA
jgi:(4S)-4-hydroxy-5-phosphonooxypentane-2,3-dione isomerase